MNIVNNPSKVYANPELLLNALEKNLAIIKFNRNARVSDVNDNFARSMGYTPDEMIGMHHRDFCFSDFSASPEYNAFWENLFSGSSFQDKIIRKDANGKVLHLEATYIPIFDAQNKEVIEVVKVATDITERQIQTASVTSSLQQMAINLKDQAHTGLTENENLLQSVSSITKESLENNEILESLQKKSRDIYEIIQTIREISAQTNLLAVNAAIEAARAGVHGRAFDVVAKEVRKLSNRVENSIGDVRTHVDGIGVEIDRISSGTLRVQKYAVQSQEQIHATLGTFKGVAESAAKLDEQAQMLHNII
ncbi:methyl-accepting chemotaxis protein [Domibacillus robiginosus]|uniref:methyl-accepting chemotaxis protein n=1 Tax=Domibacillus robiginosus TaxID=1071054 RepID=UPI00067DD545|nr:methyl-accepting chemotaxis protein [Domibacillus robiginosus]